jgi:hypothetical protein
MPLDGIPVYPPPGGPILARVVVEVLGRGAQVSRSLREGPLRIGRAPGNEVMPAHAKVSSFHAVIALVDGDVTLTDLGSTNGTTRNGEPVKRTTPVRSGDVVGLGGVVDLLVRIRPERVDTPILVIEDRTAGVLHAVGTALRVGADTLDAREVDGGLWLDDADGGRVIAIGQPFTAGGHDLVARRLSAGSVATTRDDAQPFPYVVTAGLGELSSPFATFERPDGASHRIGSENRAAMVYLLARYAAETERPDGWVDDEALRVGIWGRDAHQQLANNLNVIIRRTRQELDQNGFDGRCIEKVHGYTRLFVAGARVA